MLILTTHAMFILHGMESGDGKDSQFHDQDSSVITLSAQKFSFAKHTVIAAPDNTLFI